MDVSKYKVGYYISYIAQWEGSDRLVENCKIAKVEEIKDCPTGSMYILLDNGISLIVYDNDLHKCRSKVCYTYCVNICKTRCSYVHSGCNTYITVYVHESRISVYEKATNIPDGFIINGMELFLYLRKRPDKEFTVRFQILLLTLLAKTGYSPDDLDTKYPLQLVDQLCCMSNMIISDRDFIDFMFSDSLDTRNQIAVKYDVQGLLNFVLSLEL